MNRVRAALLGAALLAGTLSPLASPGAACAAEGPHAALVIDTGGAVHDFCVALPDESVSGLELIELAGRQFGLDYKLGYGGGAVCMLAGVGSTSSDCFGEYPDFWGYWRGGAGGSWTWAGSGAGSSSVTSGDVEGWSWGSGDDGASHPQPPATSFASVCVASQPEPDPGKGGGVRRDHPLPPQEDETSGPPARARPAPSGDGGRGSSGRGGRDPEDKERRAPRPTPSATTLARPTGSATGAAASDREPPEGPPLAGLAGLGVAALLGASGAALARRRGRTEKGPA